MANNRNKAIRDEEVELSIQYYGPDGLEMDADSTPEIKIVDPDGNIIVGPTSTGVSRGDTGLYLYSYDVDSDADKGLWTDVWTASVDEATLSNEFKFLVTDDSSAVAGSVTLGDEVEFDFSEAELIGLNILLKYLKARTRSGGKKPKRDDYGAFMTDGYGDMIMDDCNVFSDEILATFLCQGLSEFNMIPFFTSYTFGDEIIYKTFSHAIVEGALVVSLASQALIEKGRDFTISDGGLSYQPPALGDFLQAQYQNWMTSYRERLKFMKNSIRPGPQSFGTYTNMSSGSPAVLRMRHLRARKII
jgi:hypothetical protein